MAPSLLSTVNVARPRGGGDAGIETTSPLVDVLVVPHRANSSRVVTVTGHSIPDDGATAHTDLPYPLSPARWYALFVFAFLSANQNLIWITFSPIAQTTQRYYCVTIAEVDLLLNWGPLLFIPAAVYVARASATPEGLQRLIVGSAAVCFLATILRLIPELPHIWHGQVHIDASTNIVEYGASNWLPAHSSSAIYFLHAAAILNAIVGPVFMSLAAKLSCIWFAAEERLVSTAIGVLSLSLGTSIGYLLAPHIVTSPERMPHFLTVQAALAFVGLLCCVYLPARPPHPPSPAARSMDVLEEPPFWQSLWQALTQRSLVLLALSNAVLAGVINCFVGTLSSILPSDQYSETFCGRLSFYATVSACTAGLVASRIVVEPAFRRHLKSVCLGSTIAVALSLGWFVASLPSVVSSTPLLPSDEGTLVTAVMCAGVALGIAAPLTYELAAEVTYPLSEGISGAFLASTNNLASMLFLLVAPSMSGEFQCSLVLVVALWSVVILVPLRPVYHRLDAEDIECARLLATPRKQVDLPFASSSAQDPLLARGAVGVLSRYDALTSASTALRT